MTAHSAVATAMFRLFFQWSVLSCHVEVFPTVHLSTAQNSARGYVKISDFFWRTTDCKNVCNAVAACRRPRQICDVIAPRGRGQRPRLQQRNPATINHSLVARNKLINAVATAEPARCGECRRVVVKAGDGGSASTQRGGYRVGAL